MFNLGANTERTVWSSREDGSKDKNSDEKQKAAKHERNDGDEGFVEDYIDHDHRDEERIEMSHPDNLSTSSRDEEPEVSQSILKLCPDALHS